MKINIYSIWSDYNFYIYLAIFIASVIALLSAIRKFIDLNSSENEDETKKDETENIIADENAREEEKIEETDEKENISKEDKKIEKDLELFSLANESENKKDLSPAEEFVKNISDYMKDLDSRMKNIEKNLAKKDKQEQTIKFLSDIVSDYENLDKEKIKARIEFLISDLKK
jgi:uncharacterized coiled-coil protein SlyX/Sec-independent protein translocase protein TatA